MAGVANAPHMSTDAENKASAHPQEHENIQQAAAPKVSRRFRQRSEVARVGEVLRYLSAWKAIYPSAKLVIDDEHAINFDKAMEVPSARQMCPDKALVSLGQLCALQLGVRVVQVSMVCRTNEHILVDVSQTTALQQRRSDSTQEAKPCDVGTTSFDRDEGFAILAISAWQSARRPRSFAEPDTDTVHADDIAQHYSVFTDMHTTPANAESLARRRLAQQMPWLRFVASVPLRTGQGSVVGALTIMDDKPRAGLHNEELNLLEELADTAMEHMHSIVVRAQQQRSQKLIQGLYLFNSGASSMRDWWQQQDDAKIQQQGRNMEESTEKARNDRVDREFGEKIAPSDQPSVLSPGHTTDARPAISWNRPVADHNEVAKPATEERIVSAFGRAANLMREAMGVSGVAVMDLDASLQGEDDTDNPTSDGSSSSSGQSDDAITAKEYSSIHSYSTRQRSSVDGHDTGSSTLRLRNLTLQRLIKAYPNGAIFHLGADREVYLDSVEDSSSAGSSDPAQKVRQPRSFKDIIAIVKAIKNVRSLAFVPLRDPSSDQCRSCTIVWNDNPQHVMDAQRDLVYLQTFGHSIMAELARIHSVAADTAKSRFLSTVSHEMRSPLHAILGGMEFLKDTELNSFQRDMAATVSQAGQTLLETVEHILDYSKISSTIRATSSETKSRASAAAKSPIIDLAQLTERTVETCVTAHRSQMETSNTSGLPQDGSHPSTSPQQYSAALSRQSDVALTLNIVPRLNWVVAMAPGAWTRILTNLVGNALKYTHEGHITVRLEATPSDIIEEGSSKSIQHDTPEITISLTVQDTGIGMSEAFLTDGAFIPFKQQDPLSVGAGLGLSIVNQIANDIGATIELDTEQGRGTKLKLEFRTRLHNAGDDALGPQEGNLNAMSLRVGTFQLHVADAEVEDVPAETDRIIGESVLETAQAWMKAELRRDMQVSDTAAGSTAVSAITERTLKHWQKTKSAELNDILSRLATRRSHILILADNIRAVVPDADTESLPIQAVFVHQPIGPRKLLRAIATDQDSSEASSGAYDIATLPDRSASKADRQAPWHPALARNASSQARLWSATRSAASSSRISTISSVSSPTEALPATPSETDSTFAESEPVFGADRQTVLLVEDNPLNMKLLVAMARKLKAPYRCAVNGQEAVNMYKEDHKHLLLILMDISMPVMDGFAATRGIREHEHADGLPRVYIAALTGVTDAESKSIAFACGVDDFYSKPVGMQELQVLLHKVQRSDEQVQT